MDLSRELLTEENGLKHVIRLPASETGEVYIRIQRNKMQEEDNAENATVVDVDEEIERIGEWQKGNLVMRLNRTIWERSIRDDGPPQFLYTYV